MAILDDLIALLNADWFERFQARSASFMLPTIQRQRDETVTIRGDDPPLDCFAVDTGALSQDVRARAKESFESFDAACQSMETAFSGIDTGALQDLFTEVVTRTGLDEYVIRHHVLREQTQAIGNQSCANNARSPYLRCAINPCGPCEGCKSFEEMSYE
jgi:hypothetical protein